MKRLAAILFFVLAACAPAKPSFSADLRSRLNTILADGATLTAMTAQGITFSDLSQQLAKAKGDYDLALATPSPKSISPETKTALDQAFTGWTLVHDIWNKKIQDGGGDLGSSDQLFADVVAYAGESNLDITVAPYKTFMDYDPTIRVLLSIASGHWKDGQALLLAELK